MSTPAYTVNPTTFDEGYRRQDGRTIRVRNPLKRFKNDMVEMGARPLVPMRQKKQEDERREADTDFAERIFPYKRQRQQVLKHPLVKEDAVKKVKRTPGTVMYIAPDHVRALEDGSSALEFVEAPTIHDPDNPKPPFQPQYAFPPLNRLETMFRMSRGVNQMNILPGNHQKSHADYLSHMNKMVERPMRDDIRKRIQQTDPSEADVWLREARTKSPKQMEEDHVKNLQDVVDDHTEDFFTKPSTNSAVSGVSSGVEGYRKAAEEFINVKENLRFFESLNVFDEEVEKEKPEPSKLQFTEFELKKKIEEEILTNSARMGDTIRTNWEPIRQMFNDFNQEVGTFVMMPIAGYFLNKYEDFRLYQRDLDENRIEELQKVRMFAGGALYIYSLWNYIQSKRDWRVVQDDEKFNLYEKYGILATHFIRKEYDGWFTKAHPSTIEAADNDYKTAMKSIQNDLEMVFTEMEDPMRKIADEVINELAKSNFRYYFEGIHEQIRALFQPTKPAFLFNEKLKVVVFSHITPNYAEVLRALVADWKFPGTVFTEKIMAMIREVQEHDLTWMKAFQQVIPKGWSSASQYGKLPDYQVGKTDEFYPPIYWGRKGQISGNFPSSINPDEQLKVPNEIAEKLMEEQKEQFQEDQKKQEKEQTEHQHRTEM